MTEEKIQIHLSLPIRLKRQLRSIAGGMDKSLNKFVVEELEKVCQLYEQWRTIAREDE